MPPYPQQLSFKQFGHYIKQLFAIVLMTGCLVNNKSFAEAQTFTLVIDANCPYFCDIRSDSKKGVLLELIEAVVNKAGFELKIKYSSSRRMINMVRQGSADATLYSLGFTNDLGSEITVLNRAIAEVPLCIVQPKENKKQFHTLESIRDIRLGLVALADEFSQTDMITNLEKNNQLIQISTDHASIQLVKMLHQKRIDASIFECDTAMYYTELLGIKNNFNFNLLKELDQLNTMGLVLSSQKISKNNSLSRLEKAFSEIRQSGLEKQLFIQYDLPHRMTKNLKPMINKQK